MADSIPRAYLKELTDTLRDESLKVAFFVNVTNYDPLTGTTYAALVAGGATEVANGNGYTTGGTALSGLASVNLATCGAKLTANVTTVTTATFTYRYSVVYNATSGKIRLIKDHINNKTVTGGTVTMTWDAVYGVIYHTFTI